MFGNTNGNQPNRKNNMYKEFFRFAVPSVTGMVVTSLYTIIDGIFVGRGVGELALGSVNLVYPFIMLISRIHRHHPMAPAVLLFWTLIPENPFGDWTVISRPPLISPFCLKLRGKS